MPIKDFLRPYIPEVLLRWRQRALVRKRALNSVVVDFDQIEARLRELGIRDGDCIFVHSSMMYVLNSLATTTRLPSILRTIVGGRGNILMPTFSYDPTVKEFLKNSPRFDVQVTPTRMGILNEFFRRQPGVRRSLHPTHSVAVAGPDADWFTRDHLAMDTPFHPKSPFARLEERGGKILFFGANPALNLTHIHVAEDALGEDRFPVQVYLPGLFPVSVVDYSGEAFAVQIRAHDESAFTGIDISKLTRRMDFPTWHAHGFSLALLDARAVSAEVRNLLTLGKTVYSD